MRVFHIQGFSVAETDALPQTLPAQGFVWVALGRREFELLQTEVQQCLHALCGAQLVDLHISDLLNKQLPSHYDYTGQYDVLVFRRLAQGRSETNLTEPGQPLHQSQRRGGPPVLRRIDTSPVGFALFDQMLVTIHPTDCAVRETYAARLLGAAEAHDRAARAYDALESAPLADNGGAPFVRVDTRLDARATAARLMPTSSADLMLRLVNHMVDGYLELRRELTRQLDHWQSELLDPRTRFNNWNSLLDARLSLHQLDEICEDQRAAIQDWIEALNSWPVASTPEGQREFELLKVRSRDVLEHIERVVHHVRRLEQSAEAAVQMHFSAQSHRANDIMRTLTALTAIFLPLNLMAGIFGMNFEFMPLLHTSAGFWWAMLSMGAIAVGLSVFFWRKRYLSHEL